MPVKKKNIDAVFIIFLFIYNFSPSLKSNLTKVNSFIMFCEADGVTGVGTNLKAKFCFKYFRFLPLNFEPVAQIPSVSRHEAKFTKT